MRLSLLKMQQDYLVDLEDAVVAVKERGRKGQAEPDPPSGGCRGRLAVGSGGC